MLQLLEGDIALWDSDRRRSAVVNPANVRLEGSVHQRLHWRHQGRANVDAALHEVAGPDLLLAAQTRAPVKDETTGARLSVAETVVTPGYGLASDTVIHTVCPWHGYQNDALDLARCYVNAVTSIPSDISAVAFPALGCGVRSWPYDEAAEVALDAVSSSIRSCNSPRVEVLAFVFREHAGLTAWRHACELRKWPRSKTDVNPG